MLSGVPVLIPYHIDERLPDLATALPLDWAHTTVVVDLPAGPTGWWRLVPLYSAVAEAVAADTAERRVVISGCCCPSLGIMAGLQRAGIDAGVVWFDAHGDVQTMETTTSGYLGGLPLRMLVGYRPELVAEPIGLRPIPEERAMLVDARDLDPPEVAYLESAAVRRCTVEDVEAPDGPLLLHIDLDVIDPADLPGLRFPVPGGPSAASVVAAVRRILDTGRVAAFDIACTWDPSTPDSTGRRAALLGELLSA